jgi:hypothetical protein
MPVGRRKVNITQQDHPIGQVGPQSAVALLTRAAAKAGLGKGQEAAVKKKYQDQDAAYAKAHARIKNQGKTAAVAAPRKKQPTRMAKK